MCRVETSRRRLRAMDGHASVPPMNLENRRRREGLIFLVLFGLTIPAANWLIGNAGAVCIPGGLCLIPVAPGILAPSGVLMIGIALVLRDLVQRRLGIGISVL